MASAERALSGKTLRLAAPSAADAFICALDRFGRFRLEGDGAERLMTLLRAGAPLEIEVV